MSRALLKLSGFFGARRVKGRRGRGAYGTA